MTDGPAHKPTTTYTVLRRADDVADPQHWELVGKFTVPQGRADQARNRALAQLQASEETRADEHTIVAVTGWRPETYEMEPPPPPKFKKKTPA